MRFLFKPFRQFIVAPRPKPLINTFKTTRYFTMSATQKSWKDFTPDELAKIEHAREATKLKNEPHDPKATYKKVCPVCNKPNALEVNFCTGCSFNLTEWDIKKQSNNIFLDLINGEDTGTNVLLRTDEFLVFDDKFGVSANHLDIIPVVVIDDILSLDSSHIPMLEKMYQLGVDEFKKRIANKQNVAITLFENLNIEDYVIAGYNFPVSVKHLHLHFVMPPFTHEKVFQYPRWHSHKKVMDDLKKHGKVIPYAVEPNDEEGLGVYNTAIKNHREFLAKLPSQ